MFRTKTRILHIDASPTTCRKRLEWLIKTDDETNRAAYKGKISESQFEIVRKFGSGLYVPAPTIATGRIRPRTSPDQGTIVELDIRIGRINLFAAYFLFLCTGVVAVNVLSGAGWLWIILLIAFYVAIIIEESVRARKIREELYVAIRSALVGGDQDQVAM